MTIDPVYTISLFAGVVLAVASIALGPRSERLPRWAAYIFGCAVIWAAFAVVQIMRPSSGLAAVADLTIIMAVALVAAQEYHTHRADMARQVRYLEQRQQTGPLASNTPVGAVSK